MVSRAGGLRPILCAAMFAPVLLCAQASRCDSKTPRTRPTTRAATKPAERPDPYAATLKEMGINADREGIGKFLRELHPTEATLKRVRVLIRQLGSALWRQRQAASRELLTMPAVPQQAYLPGFAPTRTKIHFCYGIADAPKTRIKTNDT